jgi:SnoaL-like domain
MTTRHESAGQVWLAYNAAENARDFDSMMSLVAPHLSVVINGAPALSSAADDERAMHMIIETYPDYRREVETVVEIDGGRQAVALWRMRGTSPFATAPDLDVAGCSVVQADAGVLTHAQLYYQATVLDELLQRAAAAG